jgi:hypothetical protein
VASSPLTIEEVPSARTTEEAAASPAPATQEEAPVGVAETGPTVSPANEAEAAMDSPAMPVEPVTAGLEAADGMSEPAEAADEYDEALLDMIALEMAAPDPDDDTPKNEAYEIEAAELPPAEPIIVAESPEPIAAAVQPSHEPSVQPSLEPEPSLGSSLIANGIVQRPRASRPDPLAPIRRMSQTEKIAFFS